jgi:anti-sigma28 factor (negative regulator of flagellin synthesis)
MRIDDLNRTPGTQGTEQSGPTAPTRALGKDSPGKDASDQGAVTGTDQATVSDLAQSLAAPSSGHIEQLRLEVQSGSYDVSPQAVAGSLIEAHLKD